MRYQIGRHKVEAGDLVGIEKAARFEAWAQLKSLWSKPAADEVVARTLAAVCHGGGEVVVESDHGFAYGIFQGATMWCRVRVVPS